MIVCDSLWMIGGSYFLQTYALFRLIKNKEIGSLICKSCCFRL